MRQDQGKEVMIAPYHNRSVLMAEARRMSRRGDIRILAERPVWREERQLWVLPIRRVRPAPPRWTRGAIITGSVLTGIATLLGLGWWLLTSLSGTALFVLCSVAGATLLIWLRAAFRPRVQVTTITTVNIR